MLETVGEVIDALNKFPRNMKIRALDWEIYGRYSSFTSVSRYERYEVPIAVLHLGPEQRDKDQ